MESVDNISKWTIRESSKKYIHIVFMLDMSFSDKERKFCSSNIWIKLNCGQSISIIVCLTLDNF